MSGAPGMLVDAILVLVVVEALLLWRWRRASGQGLAEPLLVLASGACLLLAVRAALSGAGSAVLAALTAAGLVHAAWLAVSSRARR